MDSQLVTQGSSQTIEQDMACVRCAYNLRTLAKTGLCPECGLEVARTLAAMEVADARWLRRMTWGLQLFFLAAALGLQGVDFRWNPWHRLLLGGATLIGLAWLVTVRIPNWLGRSSIPHARWIARAAITGMAPMFLWCRWRQYDRQGTLALSSLLLIVGLVACFGHLADVARHLKLKSLARPLLGVPILLVAGMMPKAIGYWGFTRSGIRPSFDQRAWYYAGSVVHMGGWMVAMMLVGRLLCKLDQVQGISIEHLSIDRRPAGRLRWGIILISMMPLVYFLLGNQPVWFWQVAFPVAIVAYVTGLWLISTYIADRRGMRIALRMDAIILLLSSAGPLTAASWELYGDPAITVVLQVFVISLIVSVCLSLALLRGIVTGLGYSLLARSLALRSVLLPMLFLLSYGMDWLLFSARTLRGPIQEVCDVMYWIVLLATLESLLALGRLVQAMMGNRECKPAQ